MTNLSLTQGYPFYYNVKTLDSKLVFMDLNQKFTLSAIEQDSKYYIYSSPETTSGMVAGVYKFQLLDSSGIVDSGFIQVKQNFELIDEIHETKTENEKILEAIEAQIAGKATSAQQEIHVGDKSIKYCTLDELFKLKNYFKSKVAEERGESDVSMNGGKIKYIWRLR